MPRACFFQYHSPPSIRCFWIRAGLKKKRLIVVGSGFTGLAAAIEAHQAGASVAVLEKMAGFGGNSVISAGGKRL
jgi:NADPH-dependent 2,4-dienoyl-CoA reductase/sulfur reductase-like enzyme